MERLGLWRSMDDIWRFGALLKSSSLVASGHLYTLNERQLMKYDAEKNDWLLETVFPTKFRGAPVCTAEWRGHIFVTKICGDHQVCYFLADAFLLLSSTTTGIVPTDCFHLSTTTGIVPTDCFHSSVSLLIPL
jgi:hypothetical protein